MKVEPRANRPNCFVIPPITGNTVLTYALETNTDPLRVGKNNASLQFVVTNITSRSQVVTSIVFGLPVGGGGITPTIKGIDTALSDTMNWEASISPPSSGIANVTLTPQGGYSMPVNASIVLTLFKMQTVSSAGNSNITITETIGSSSTNGDFQVSIFPADFYFEGLAACVYNGSQLTPVAQVNNGADVYLTWNASVADLNNITIYWSDPVKGQQSATPTEVGIWPTKKDTPKTLPLSSDTTFTVTATASTLDGQPMTLSRSVGVSVLNPSLVAATLEALTNILIHSSPPPPSGTPLLQVGPYGDVTIDNPGVVGGRFIVKETSGYVGINTPSPANTLEVTGNTQVNGNIGVTGVSQLAGGIKVTGASTLASLTVTGNTSLNGNLGVTGPSTLASLVVTGNLTANFFQNQQQLYHIGTWNNTTSYPTNPTKLSWGGSGSHYLGWYGQAPSDGFLTAYLQAYDDGSAMNAALMGYTSNQSIEHANAGRVPPPILTNGTSPIAAQSFSYTGQRHLLIAHATITIPMQQGTYWGILTVPSISSSDTGDTLTISYASITWQGIGWTNQLK